MSEQLKAWDVVIERLASRIRSSPRLSTARRPTPRSHGYLNLNQPDYKLAYETLLRIVNCYKRREAARLSPFRKLIMQQLAVRSKASVCGTGRAFGWCILVLTFSSPIEVIVRYVFNAPTVWAFDMMVQMYGALFLNGGAVCAGAGLHVRGDVLYRLFPVRWQARIDFVLYILFFFPGMLALFWFGYENCRRQLALRGSQLEQPCAHSDLLLQIPDPCSRIPSDRPGRRRDAPRAGIAMKTGQWMERLNDVRETEDILIEKPQ